MSDAATFEDAFNLLCGEKIGRGAHREVFECRIRRDLVVKVENQEMRYFANVLEDKFWADHQFYRKVADWLAPCEYLSPDGRILLQRRATPIHDRSQMPEKMPAFLTDLRIENFGLLDGRVVCIDYALTIPNPSTRLKPAGWD